MLWPQGFAKVHKKEVVQYRSDQSLHNGKTPYLAVSLPGGVIIDLATTEIQTQIEQLLEVNELQTDEELQDFLASKIE